jgi:hypothetical protein
MGDEESDGARAHIGRQSLRVLFVYPEFPDTYRSFRHALSSVGKRSAFPPLGLFTVSAMLPREWERREFWRFLRQVVSKHRDRFGHAVALAAMGHHFRKHTEVCFSDR